MKRTPIRLEAEATGVLVTLDPTTPNSNHIEFSVVIFAEFEKKAVCLHGGLGDLWVKEGEQPEVGGNGLWLEESEIYSEVIFKLLDEVRRFHPKIGAMVEESDLL